ncbi:MAG: IS200/IS605 family transposase [Sphaerochaetaceae bacterium]|jgi:putative transposase|nr:IS200/IS605 family transposase [Sphaerochaetaceae bacterium]
MAKQEHWVSARGCVYNVYYHFVWSTKYRRKVLVGSIAEDLHWLHELIAEQKDITLINQEIMPDHVHLFVTAHPIFAPANIVKIFKGIAAKKLFEKHPELRKQLWNGHLWNPSYYVGTCGDATKDVIERYVEMQKVK